MECLSLKSWIGNVAVVTGASSGIGAAIAEKLVIGGLTVAGISRNEIPIQEMMLKLKNEKGRLLAYKCDITNEKQLLENFELIENEAGPISVLINNAGVMFDGDLLNGDTELWRKTMETNVIAKCVATREAIKHMKENQIDGQIIHINSVLGHNVYNIPNMNVYPASQFAITALNETLRHELIENNSKIKITNISPGPVETKMFDPEKPLKSKIKSFLKPQDVADAVVYVLSTPRHVHVQDLIIRPVGEPY